MNKKIYEKIARLLPDKLRIKAEDLSIYVGREKDAALAWLGMHFMASLIVGIAIGLLLQLIWRLGILYSLIAGTGSFIILLAGFFANLYLLGDKRAKAIEKVLPSALQLMSANIRAGMTPDRAIWLSARPEFGPLQQEIKRIGSETISGAPVKEAFINISKRIRSRILERTVRLIVEGMGSGGELAKLLDETASEIQATATLQKEMTANVAMYTMFITFASLIGAPLLLAISTFFVGLLSAMGEAVGAGALAMEAEGTGVSLITFSAGVTQEFLVKFAVVVITITTFFASLLIGLIKKGDEKRGLEYAPLFVALGIVFYFLIKMFVTKTFGGFVML